MKIAILGAGGLIGHALSEQLSKRFGDVTAVLHQTAEVYGPPSIFDGVDVIENVEATEFEVLTGVLKAVNPDVVLNCVGITKRRPEVNTPSLAITVNALLPHRLGEWCRDQGKRMLHFSTDCVFNGALGDYTEDSPTTGEDAYGRTKALGEVRDNPKVLTLRSSFIGLELKDRSELLEWFLSQAGGEVKGFTDAWYSGVSTITMARVVGDILEGHPDLSGLYQLAVEKPISKFDLLQIANEAFETGTKINADDSFSIKPTLDGSKLRQAMGLTLPDWPTMMRELAEDAGGAHAERIQSLRNS